MKALKRIKLNNAKIFSIFALITASIFIYGCSQESNSKLSVAYHNTTAHYNAYFLAKEKLLLVETDLAKTRVDDYNKVLRIYHFADSSFSQQVKADIDYIVERATYPIKEHKNSKWVDDSYMLIGKARRINNQMEYAIKTFKYVNTTSPDEQTRYAALIELLICHLKTEELHLAHKVQVYLDNQFENFNKENQLNYHLAYAEYARMEGEYKTMMKHVDEALPFVKGKDNKSRLNFISGQLHQKFNEDSAAYQRYVAVLKRRPHYELEFNTKLNMSNVYSTGDKDDTKKIYKYFAKFLKDEKNLEYQDRIYYDLAKFEYKQGHTNEALVNLTKSVQVETARPLQKSYSYRFAGNIYYDRKDMKELTKYQNSKLYYDSCVTYINPDISDYNNTLIRKDVLTRFVEQLEIVETEDSLQRLAKMDSASLMVHLAKIAELQEKQMRDKAERDKLLAEELGKKKNQSNEPNNATFGGNGSNNFIFYNPAAYAQSELNFKRTWGDRALEDNWRRAKKDQVIKDEQEILPDSAALAALADSVANDSIQYAKAIADSIAEANRYKVDPNSLFASVPKDKASIEASNRKIEIALFKLGKIAKFELHENEFAIKVFKKLNTEYPENKDYVETLYFLYLLCLESPSCNSDDYKNELISRFPNSIFAKLAENPNYLEDYKDSNKSAALAYENAYSLYTNGNHVAANKLVNETILLYPKSDIMDKMVFLKILTLARQENYADYLNGLEQFKKDFPTSPLVSYADELLKMKEELEKRGSLEKNTTYAVDKSDSAFYFIAFYNKNELTPEETMAYLKEFNNDRIKNLDFRMRKIDFNDEKFAVVLKKFSSAAEAKDYVEKLIRFDEFKETFKKQHYSYVFISDKNYNTLLGNRDIEKYKAFYNKNY